MNGKIAIRNCSSIKALHTAENLYLTTDFSAPIALKRMPLGQLLCTSSTLIADLALHHYPARISTQNRIPNMDMVYSSQLKESVSVSINVCP